MRRVIEIISCDVCAQEVPEAEVRPVQFSWDGADYEIEVDPECLLDLTTQPVSLLMQSARPLPKAKPSRAKRTRTGPLDPETWCPHCTMVASSARGLRAHITRAHSETKDEGA